jgi:hypothetical protein
MCYSIGDGVSYLSSYTNRSTIEEMAMELMTRTIPVNRARTNKEAFAATGRVLLDIRTDAFITIPCREGDFTATFVNICGHPAPDQLERELAKLGWQLIADPIGLATFNEEEHSFADEYPNATQWKDANGKYCYVIFDRMHGQRTVSVSSHSDDFWSGIWWFPCHRKN